MTEISPRFAYAVTATDLVAEGWQDATRGTGRWRTLVGADNAGMVAGLAEFGPGETLSAHRHTPPEVYFGVAGRGTVTIDGRAFDLTPGVAVYIPPDAEHETVAGPDGLTFFYSFPCGSFADVDYRFTAPAASNTA